MDQSNIEGLTPKQIVKALSKYIVGQDEAKKSVAIAIRNRARRKMVDSDIRDEIAPKNIIMIGPTGVGKTEIARRLSSLARAPFIKVEATKYTEVGYVGRDVESMIRDLTSIAINMVKKEHQEEVMLKAKVQAEDALLELLLPMPRKTTGPAKTTLLEDFTDDDGNMQITPEGDKKEKTDKSNNDDALFQRTKEKMRGKLRKEELEEKVVELEVSSSNMPFVEVFSNIGIEDMDINFQNMLSNMMPSKRKVRKVTIKEARKIIIQQEIDRLIDMDKVVEEAVNRTENMGIVFLDEIDKIAGKESGHGPEVSREGVQRDILPIIEGSTVNTKYGPVNTDHILFIAAGAFHVNKPSDLIPELQGRFPIRVELDSLTRSDFKRILTKPKNALIKQYEALMLTEGLHLTFKPDAVDELSKVAEEVNKTSENIGARRLHTIMEKLLEEISFNAPDIKDKKIIIDRDYVQQRLSNILESQDLSSYIL